MNRISLSSPWLDVLLPLSILGLAFERNADPLWMILILTLWCVLKFVNKLSEQPIYGVLIGVLMVSLGAIVHPLSTSSSSDLILVLMAFAAGLQQTNKYWQVALFMLLAGVIVAIPFVEFGKTFNGNLGFIPFSSVQEVLPQYAVRIQKITINRSGYLFGLMALAGCGLWRFSRHGIMSWLAGIGGAISFVLAFATGSRAAFVLPVVAVIFAECCWRWRVRVTRSSGQLAGAVLAIAMTLNLLLYLPMSPLAYRNTSDAARADVAQCFVKQSLGRWPEVVVGAGFDRRSDNCFEITEKNPKSLYQKGIPHAHNAFLQVLGDQGLITLLLMIVSFWLVLRRLFDALQWDDWGIAWTGLACVFFILFSGIIESTLIKTSLQQVVTGYLLSTAWMSPSGDEKQRSIKCES
ncbi:hypothetical protein WB44_12340 [Synechococcus sp. WH 8020]|uniref:O-antigen ligase family protein n=1 Tax=Synechococcus sp. (strain WH8020) TaxID=32052 RepID=UPI0006528592|nr:O-antigen ligase family protein [Synechococcus sp. WH 8020]AKN61753.1 hypothetical protein WB44_12340 [Synechococcus sp. WH 8020]